MENPIKYQLLESCWKESLDWTYKLIDVLKSANINRSKISDLEESKRILSDAKKELIKSKMQILLKLESITQNLKIVRNFKSSIEKLLNSTEINLSRMSKMVIPLFDLFDSIENKEMTKEKLFGYDFSTCSLSATRNQAKFLATRRSRLDLTSGKCIRFALFTIRPLVAQFEVTKRP